MESDANSTEETSLNQFFPPDSPHINDLFGDQQVNPRIGNGFQVEVPPMITGSKYIQLLMNPIDSDYIFDVSHSFLMGLSIPIMWLRNELNSADESVKYTKRKKNKTNTGKKISELNVSELNDRKESEPKGHKAKIACRTNLDQLSKCISCSPAPGLLGDPWKDAEKDIFLLGLHIFGKNFFQIKRFIETKEMGDILSFYYGEFYRSAGYRRWTDCRKPRSRKCVYGRKIFSGWRQQELLSRLLAHIPEESQNSLLEVSKSFALGRTSLESYVSSLKATVGIRALVDSVGIGKGKEDLTSLTMEPVKTNQVFPVCHTMPGGKACSSLTSTDIIKLLTGDFRLSKARCNDIFWEAVWPRLLARGWHSEQPRNRGYVSSKDYLVFLMPGIKKFSRRKLVKGGHYFDSISDILKKVASEPKLLELEADEARFSIYNEEDQWVREEFSDQDNPSNHRPHRYLKPLTSNCNLMRMKFMVVDSSLVQEGKSSKEREIRYLPVDVNDTYKLTDLLRKNEGFEIDPSDMLLKEDKNISAAKHGKDVFCNGDPKNMKFMVVDTSLVDGGKSSRMKAFKYCPVEARIPYDFSFLSRVEKGNSFDDSLDDHESNMADKILSSEPEASDSLLNTKIYKDCVVAVDGAISHKKALNSNSGNNVEISQDQRANYAEDKMLSNRIIKLHFSRRSETDNADSLAPLVKRRRPTACVKTERCISAMDLSDAGDNDVSQVDPLLEKISPLSFSAERSPEEDISRGMPSGSCFGMDTSHGKNKKLRTLSSIDLKVSQIPSGSDNGEVLMMKMERSQAKNSNGSLVHESKLNLAALNTSVDVSTAAHQPAMNTRRQSTRKRPLTAKALEALACGFWHNIKKKQKSKDFRTREIPFSNPSRKARSKVKPSSKRVTAGISIVDLKVRKESNETSVSKISQPVDQYEEESHS